MINQCTFTGPHISSSHLRELSVQLVEETPVTRGRPTPPTSRSQRYSQVLLCGILKSDGEKVGPGAGEGNSKESGVSILESSSKKISSGVLQGSEQQLRVRLGQDSGQGVLPGLSECNDQVVRIDTPGESSFKQCRLGGFGEGHPQ